MPNYIKVKTGASSWSTATKAYVKKSTGWVQPIRIWMKLLSGWTRIWPTSGPFAETSPYIVSTTSGSTHLLPTAPLRIGTTYYGRNGVWNANGWTISSYNYQWRRYSLQDAADDSGQTNRLSGTFASPSIGYTPVAADDKKYLSFQISPVTTDTFEISEAESGDDDGRLFAIRRPPINTAMSLSLDTKVGTAISYGSSWNVEDAYAPEASRTLIVWYRNTTASLTGATAVKVNLGTVAGAYSYTPVAADENNYIIAKETCFNSGSDYTDGYLTLANTIGSGTPLGVSAVAITSSTISGILNPPTSLTATSNRGDGVLLQWNAVPGANYYEIYWQSTQGVGSINQSTYADFGQDNSIIGTSFIDTTITPGTTRYYRVRARSQATSQGSNCSNWYPTYGANAITGFRMKPGAITNYTAYSFEANIARGYFTTGINTDSVQYKLQGIDIPISTPTYTQSTASSYPYGVSLNTASLFTEKVWNYDTYSATATYKYGQSVWYAGNQYSAIKYVFRSTTPYDEIGFSGVAISNTSYWTIISTKTYTVGDYVNYYGTRFYAKQSMTGVYPATGPYWSNGLGTWRYEFTPFYGTAAGDTVYSSSTRTLNIYPAQAGDPMSLATAITFDNITSSSFRGNYTTGNYANYVYINAYKNSNSVSSTGYPKIKSIASITAYTETPSEILASATIYGLNVIPRYYYSIALPDNGMPDIYYEGTGATNSVQTLSPPPGTFTYSIANSTITPTWPNGAGINITGSSSNIMTVTWNAATNAFAGTNSGENSYGDQVSGVYNYPSIYRLNATTDTWSYGSSGNESATIYAYNYNRSSLISWTAAANAGSYKVNYTISGATSGNGTFTSAALPSTQLSYNVPVGTGGGTVAVNIVTAYATSDGSGTSSTNGTLSGSSSNVPTVAIASATSGNFYLTYTPPATAPSGGSVSVSPTSGTAGTTQFTASASGWSGTAPITYAYVWSYFNQSFQWVSAGTGPTFTPSVISPQPFTWRVVVTATNSVGSATAETNYTVNPPPVIPTVTIAANTGVSSTGGTINWTSTNQSTWSSTGTFAGSGTSERSVAKTGLAANTAYTGTITVTSSTGNQASANYSLTTSAAATAPGTPVVSGDNSLTVGGTFSWSCTGSPTPVYRVTIGYNSTNVAGPFSTRYQQPATGPTVSNGLTITSIRPGYDLTSGLGWAGAGYYRCTIQAINSAGGPTSGSVVTYMS
jgi:hypothetical protein